MNIQEQEDRDFHYASESEWDCAEAMERGSQNKDQCWILTDRDVWHKNPHFVGKETRHPEDDSDCYEGSEENLAADRAAFSARIEDEDIPF